MPRNLAVNEVFIKQCYYRRIPPLLQTTLSNLSVPEKVFFSQLNLLKAKCLNAVIRLVVPTPLYTGPQQ